MGIPLRSLYLRGAAALAGVAALAAIATVLSGDFGETEGKIFATIAATFVGGSAVVAGIACLGRASGALGTAGIVLAIGGFVLWTEQIWAEHESDTYWKVLGLLLTWTLATLVGMASALMTRTQRHLHLATLSCAAAAGLFASVMILREQGDGWQAFAVFLILTLLGLILTPIFERSRELEQRPEERVLGSLGDVTVIAVRQPGKRVVRIGDQEASLAADESVVLRAR